MTRIRKAEKAAYVAKNEKKVTAQHRRTYVEYDADVRDYGKAVADYNAGWIKGSENGERRMKSRIRHLLKQL